MPKPVFNLPITEVAPAPELDKRTRSRPLPGPGGAESGAAESPWSPPTGGCAHRGHNPVPHHEKPATIPPSTTAPAPTATEIIHYRRPIGVHYPRTQQYNPPLEEPGSGSDPLRRTPATSSDGAG